MKIGIIDYGSGNLHSAHNAVRQAASVACPSDEIVRITSASELKGCDRIILPGVGHFANCYSSLAALDEMIDCLNDLIRVQARPFLGICVGMQLLAGTGNEGGKAVPGLGWIPGEVIHLGSQIEEQGLPVFKVPHMGWNDAQLNVPSPLIADVGDEPRYYFVHSYICEPSDINFLGTRSDFGNTSFCL